ncbi:MAG: type IV pilus twitching motility protein PilT [Terrimicrobiaceae bacterium]|nr:type IV pilus twitching motility protein PilT [Terrimicrobiaceae bacterium]
MPDLIDLLSRTVAAGGSDLHLTTGAPPMARISGSLAPLIEAALDADACRSLVLGILTESQRARLEEDWELDFAFQVDGLGRFRANAHYSRGSLEAAFRAIPEAIPELGTLGHRESVFQLCELQRGLVLVTGITGSGKSTTMAAMVQQISRRRSGVIVTIEDPVEYIFQNATSIVKQREVGSDTRSFSEALRHALRQDPDVILVGEMRDPETISAAITAAETGHLVLATLHTIDAPKAVDRMVDAFPGDQQPQIIAQLANSLEAIVSQRLIRKEDGSGRVLATEMLAANAAVRACIRERRWEQLVGLIEIGAKDGMHTIDEDLAGLYLSRTISKEDAIANARDRNAIEALLRESTPPPKRGLFR